MTVFGIGHAMTDVFCPLGTENTVFPPPLLQGEIIHITQDEMDSLLSILEAASPDFSALSQVNRVSGGTAANILKAASSLGADCEFYGAAGSVNGERDSNAFFFQKELGVYGVRSFLTSENAATGRFLIVKTAGGLFAGAASPSAAKKITPAHVNERFFARCDFVVLEGMICMNEAVFDRIVRLCVRYGVLPVIDAASPFAAEQAIVPSLNRLVAAGLPFVLFVNETEAAAVARAAGTDFEVFARRVCSKNPKTVVIQKLGAKGSCAFRGADFFESPVEARDAFDATGAGDVFAGAFLTSYYGTDEKKDNLPLSLAFANRAASVVLDSFGCRFSPEELRSLV